MRTGRTGITGFSAGGGLRAADGDRFNLQSAINQQSPFINQHLAIIVLCAPFPVVLNLDFPCAAGVPSDRELGLRYGLEWAGTLSLHRPAGEQAGAVH